MVSISVGGGASARIGSQTFSGGGSVSADSGALGELGRAAVDSVVDLGSKAEGKAGDAARHIQGRAGEAVGVISSRSAEAFGAAAEWLAKVPTRLPNLDLSKLSVKMARPHFPPPPDIRLAMRGDMHVRLETDFHIKNGGWPKVPVTIGDVKANGDFTLINGSVPGHTRAELADFIKNTMSCVGAGATGLVRMGIDLAAACARNPLLSALLAKLPQGLQVLMDARRLVQGGFKHFFAAMMDLFKNIVSNIRIKLGGNLPPDATNMGPPTRPGGSVPGNERGPTNPERAAEASILDNPNLSFEDKLFYFCLKMAKESEDKINKMMKDWENCKKAAKGQGTPPGAGGAAGSQGPGAPAPAPGLPGAPGGPGGGGLFPQGAGSKVGNVVGIAQTLGSTFLGVAASTAPLWVPALTSLAGACCSAIPGVGPAIGGAITAIGGPTFTLLVGGVLGAAAHGLKAVPLAQMAEQAVSSMEKKPGGGGAGAPTQAKGAAAPAGNGGDMLGGLKNMDGGTKGAILGGVAGILAGPLWAPLLTPAMITAGTVMGTDNKKGAVMGAAIGGALAFGANPILGAAVAPIAIAAGAYIGSKMLGNGGPAGAGAAPAAGAAPGNGGVPSTGSTPSTGGTGSTGNGQAPTGESTITLSDGTTINAADKDSETMFSQKLTYFQQQLTKLYETIGTLMKSLHDTQMSSIRNMK